MARNPPTCPVEKRSLGENLVNDGRMWCSAQVRLRKDVRGDSISLYEISPGIGCRADYMQPLFLLSKISAATSRSVVCILVRPVPLQNIPTCHVGGCWYNKEFQFEFVFLQEFQHLMCEPQQWDSQEGCDTTLERHDSCGLWQWT